MSRRAYRTAPTDSTTFYPRLLGTHGAVAANSYLSVNAGVDVLKHGGNAIDAAVAASFVEGLVNPQMHTISGEGPMLGRPAGAGDGEQLALAHALLDRHEAPEVQSTRLRRHELYALRIGLRLGELATRELRLEPLALAARAAGQGVGGNEAAPRGGDADHGSLCAFMRHCGGVVDGAVLVDPAIDVRVDGGGEQQRGEHRGSKFG